MYIHILIYIYIHIYSQTYTQACGGGGGGGGAPISQTHRFVAACSTGRATEKTALGVLDNGAMNTSG